MWPDDGAGKKMLADKPKVSRSPRVEIINVFVHSPSSPSRRHVSLIIKKLTGACVKIWGFILWSRQCLDQSGWLTLAEPDLCCSRGLETRSYSLWSGHKSTSKSLECVNVSWDTSEEMKLAIEMCSPFCFLREGWLYISTEMNIKQKDNIVPQGGKIEPLEPLRQSKDPLVWRLPWRAAGDVTNRTTNCGWRTSCCLVWCQAERGCSRSACGAICRRRYIHAEIIWTLAKEITEQWLLATSERENGSRGCVHNLHHELRMAEW